MMNLKNRYEEYIKIKEYFVFNKVFIILLMKHWKPEPYRLGGWHWIDTRLAKTRSHWCRF